MSGPTPGSKRDVVLTLLRQHPDGLHMTGIARHLYGDPEKWPAARLVVRGLTKYPGLRVVLKSNFARIERGPSSSQPTTLKIIEGRPRGFADYRPAADRAKLITDIQAVLAEYADYLPMSQRQVYYRLVATYGYPKTEAFARLLSDVLTRARRASMVDFDDIRDDSGTRLEPQNWTPRSARQWLRQWPERVYQIDRQDGQPNQLIVACEAEGMAEQLYDGVTTEYGIPVHGNAGFAKVTPNHELGREIAQRWRAGDHRPTLVLHLGDYDPDGEAIFRAYSEDVISFAHHYVPGCEVEFRRVAVTPEQIREYDLPTQPVKETANRATAFAGLNGDPKATVQLEALPPDAIAAILRAVIEAELDRQVFDATLDREATETAELEEWLAVEDDDDAGRSQ